MLDAAFSVELDPIAGEDIGGVAESDVAQTQRPAATGCPVPHILERMAARDRTAMDACITAYGAMIWSLALRSTHGERHEAEDAVQDIYLDLWHSASRFDPRRGSEITFVALLARRKLIDRFRSRGPEVIAIEAIEVAVDDHFVQEQELVSELACVQRSFAQLRQREQQVLDLGFGEGLSQTEIVERTGFPLGTVKSLMRRGLIRLRDDLEQQAQPQGLESLPA